MLVREMPSEKNAIDRETELWKRAGHQARAQLDIITIQQRLNFLSNPDLSARSRGQETSPMLRAMS